MKQSAFFIIFLLVMRSMIANASENLRDTIKLRIDPESAIGEPCSKVFSEVSYIPIENSSKCLIGEISKLEVVEKYFVIFDRSTDGIFILNSDGTFHAKCQNIPGLRKNDIMIHNFNFNVYADFTIQRDKQQIVVQSALDRQNLFLFNYDGQYLGKRSLAADFNGKRCFGIASFSGNIYAYSVLPSSKLDSNVSTGYTVFVTNDFTSILKKQIPYNPDKIAKGVDIQLNLNGPFYYSGKAEEYYYVRSYDYNIYVVEANGVTKVYKIVLPIQYSLDSDFLTNEEKFKLKRRNYLESARQKVYAISNVFKTGDILIFELNDNKISNDNRIFAYNLKSNELVGLTHITPDSRSYFLPVVNKYSAVQACDNHGYIYSSFSSMEMFNVNSSIQDKHPNYPTTLKRFFSPQNKKGNPVIVKLKPIPAEIK